MGLLYTFRVSHPVARKGFSGTRCLGRPRVGVSQASPTSPPISPGRLRPQLGPTVGRPAASIARALEDYADPWRVDRARMAPRSWISEVWPQASTALSPSARTRWHSSGGTGRPGSRRIEGPRHPASGAWAVCLGALPRCAREQTAGARQEAAGDTEAAAAAHIRRSASTALRERSARSKSSSASSLRRFIVSRRCSLIWATVLDVGVPGGGFRSRRCFA